MPLWLEARAQVSVELIVVMAAVIVLVLLLVSRLYDTGKEASATLEKRAEDVFDKINAIAKEA